jgi:signal transduction histidine kinase
MTERFKLRLPNDPRALLRIYQWGTFCVLMLGLIMVSLICAIFVAKKESQRAQIFEGQIEEFFAFHYRSISEEMWTRNFDSIRLRVSQIARQLGDAAFEIRLLDANGKCVYQGSGSANSSDCTPTEKESELHQKSLSRAISRPFLEFDNSRLVYRYAGPIYVGNMFKGSFVAELSDPFGFHPGQQVGTALVFFSVLGLVVILVWFGWFWFSRTFLLSRYAQLFAEMEKREALSKLAAQLSHDIRSPLAALTMIVDKAREGLEPRISQLMYLSISRITGIADDLLKSYRTEAGTDLADAKSFEVVSGIFQSIVTEHSVLLESSLVQVVMEVPADLRLVGVNVNRDRLLRSLSNLINNSVESFPPGKKGLVTLRMHEGGSELFGQNMLHLSIEDNGSGMDANTLRKVRRAGGSFNKSHGHGLGLQFAKDTVAGVGGQLEIVSVQGQGTRIDIYLPRAKPPRWLVQDLSFSSTDSILVLDDDPTIHQLWKEKLRGLDVSYISDTEEFTLDKYPPSKYFYLFDYEIKNSPLTGLDLILMHRLHGRACLVTSYYEDKAIQGKIQAAGGKVIPKFLLPALEVKVRHERVALRSAEMECL